MSVPGSAVDSHSALALPLPQEEQARADLYALIARLLLAAPDAELLSAMAVADSIPSQQADNTLEQAWDGLTVAASLMNTESVREEFDALFISIGTPRINPYASLYLSGFMMEKPLAVLRDHLAILGLARMQGNGQPEDHLGVLCEVMRILITGPQGLPRRTLQEQANFFMEHLRPWYARCLDDIGNAEEANFYRHVAQFAAAFLAIECQAFEMEEACPEPCDVQ